jgi:hypothetical protein
LSIEGFFKNKRMEAKITAHVSFYLISKENYRITSWSLSAIRLMTISVKNNMARVL